MVAASRWEFDDLALGALLGAWLATAPGLWTDAVHGWCVSMDALMIVYLGRIVAFERRSNRKALAFCVALGLGAGYLLLKQGWATLPVVYEFAAIVGLWVGVFIMKWIAHTDAKAAMGQASGPPHTLPPTSKGVEGGAD